MLVVENRNRTPAFFEDFDTFLKPLVPRVTLLALFISRIIPMLGYDHHAIDGELTRPQCQSLLNRRIKIQTMSLYSPPPQITFRKLIQVNGGHINSRCLPGSTPSIPESEPVQKMLGMGMLPDFRSEKSDFFSVTRDGSTGKCPCRSHHGGSSQCGHPGEKTTSISDHGFFHLCTGSE
jgi:hypothetical protein